MSMMFYTLLLILGMYGLIYQSYNQESNDKDIVFIRIILCIELIVLSLNLLLAESSIINLSSLSVIWYLIGLSSAETAVLIAIWIKFSKVRK